MARRTFTKEFKIEAVRELEAGLSLAEASRRYEVHPNTLREWRETYREHGEEAFRGNGKLYREEAKIAALERRIGQLSMENDFLKKLIAIDKKREKMTKGTGK
jgi:transposase